MSLGGRRYGGTPAARREAVAAMTRGVPPQPVISIDPDPFVERRRTSLIPTVQTVATPFGPFDLVVATLEPAPQDRCYLLERMLVTNIGVGISLLVGQLDTSNAIDALEDNGALPNSLTAEYLPEVWVPPSQSLHIVWNDVATNGLYRANLQYAVMEV